MKRRQTRWIVKIVLLRCGKMGVMVPGKRDLCKDGDAGIVEGQNLSR